MTPEMAQLCLYGLDTVISSVVGKATDTVIEKLIKQLTNTGISQKIDAAVKRALQTTLNKSKIDKKVIHDFLQDRDKRTFTIENITSFEKELLDFLTGRSVDETLINDFLIDFENYYQLELSKDTEISQYMTMGFILAQERNRYLKVQAEKESAELIESIIRAIDSSRDADMYKNLSFINGILYPFVMRHLNSESSQYVLTMAYGLTDIYDHIYSGEKLRQLAGKLVSILEDKPDHMSRESLQTLIGCYYSLEQAVQKNENGSIQKLGAIEAQYNKIGVLVDKFEKKGSWADATFIKGLYYSDRGALSLKKYDLTGESAYLNDAKDFHEKALDERNLYFGIFKEAEGADREEAEKRKMQSSSNLAGVYFRQGEFRQALSEHEKVMAYRLENKMTTDGFLSKGYIVGCYINLWKQGELSLAEMETCEQYARECEEYYTKNEEPKEDGTKPRLNDILAKIKEIEGLKGIH